MTEERPAEVLSIDAELREALARYRTQMAITCRPTLPLDAVREVERRLSVTVPDAVWALLAAAGRDPFQVAVLTEDARELHGLAEDFVAFAHESHSGVYWCVENRVPPASPTIHEWSSESRATTQRWPHLAAFVRHRFELDRKLTSAERVQLQREVAGLEPALVAAPDEEPLRRVHHPIFGVGIVLREIAGAAIKLDVDFGPAGRRLLLASYVRAVDVDDG